MCVGGGGLRSIEKHSIIQIIVVGWYIRFVHTVSVSNSPLLTSDKRDICILGAGDFWLLSPIPFEGWTEGGIFLKGRLESFLACKSFSNFKYSKAYCTYKSPAF